MKNYDPAIDILRLISILAVVAIHTSTRTLEISHFDLANHQITLFINQATRFAVPLFFLISGFVLTLSYQKNLNYFSFLKKRLSKVLIPYVFWTIIYYFFIYTNHTNNIIDALLTGSASWQLYFIPSLLLFYAIFPFLYKSKRIFTKPFIFILLFLIELLILNYDYQYHNSSIIYPVEVFLFNFFPFIFGMAAAESKKYLNNKLIPILIIPTLYLSFFIFKEGFTNYYKTWNYIYFYSQWRPSVLIYTLLFFVTVYFLIKNINSKFILTLSKLSFFVFFIHIIILELVGKYLYQFDLLFLLVVSTISFLTAYLIHKIKFVTLLTG